ncbi:thioredoxin-dependent thiol peroxidase [Eilatimonas milleporae]|uniref:thioredoxin-dependent peroxiredoxin n=1 Tax=Eilatimonas milleporae TaxID=911205 RepID=A0A3M0CG42_9PROT|nr:thioredoxin-dependent thiol peroxidase [Eilatimonas milleporae]RMB08564.1 peroxiredoxin Q/BCP [Eilatimonas milleporae]
MSLEEGQTAPDFTLPVSGGDTLALKDLKGKPVVLYFYPKDDTPGCTTEAKDFTDRRDEFDALGATVIGVSRDTVAKHDKFTAKHDLKVILGADEDGHVTEAYGVWVEKRMYGKTYMGIQRATFLIDGNGVISRIWPKVKVKGHADEVLDAVRAL